jgi:hypothetical protein
MGVSFDDWEVGVWDSVEDGHPNWFLKMTMYCVMRSMSK